VIQNDKNWRLIPTQGFANPFATGEPIDAADPARGRLAAAGDPVPWNITTIGDRVLASYVISKASAGRNRVARCSTRVRRTR
jgi:hypothetical protein